MVPTIDNEHESIAVDVVDIGLPLIEGGEIIGFAQGSVA